jgi:hypothetical protein
MPEWIIFGKSEEMSSTRVSHPYCFHTQSYTILLQAVSVLPSVDLIRIRQIITKHEMPESKSRLAYCGLGTWMTNHLNAALELNAEYRRGRECSIRKVKNSRANILFSIK